MLNRVGCFFPLPHSLSLAREGDAAAEGSGGGDAAGKPLASQHLVEGLHNQRLAQAPGYIQTWSKYCRYYVIIYFFLRYSLEAQTPVV